jgi:tetratricopeptide (TPR) repeat protein
MKNLALTAILFAATVPAFAATAPDEAQDPTYAAATRELNREDWAEAARDFDKVIAANGKNIDAALYWKAYALEKLSRSSEAQASCAVLHTKFPASRWNSDCDALASGGDLASLRAQLSALGNGNSSFGNGSSGSNDRSDDLKVLALNSLARQDPAQAMPILRSILTGNRSEDLKQQALFILGQSKSPEADAMLRDALMGKMGSATQVQAIQSAGVFKGRAESSTLVEIYRTTPSREVKEAVVSALFVAHDAPHLVELARAEKNLDMKETIVSELAMMKDKAATDYMLELLK